MNMYTVTTPSGTIEGIRDGGVCSWRGIPYAQPLTEHRRWLPPEPVPPWEGVLKAHAFSGICPQRSLLRRNISEDCLTLNIWSPAADGKKRPVLFFIHGGSFSHGAGSELFYHGGRLSENWDVVVVTCNYRLGVLGFLDFSSLDKRFKPNTGVRDVLAALTWVQDHISCFGGDPQRVTVFGQSAGGTMISALAVTPEANRLFSRCIMISGGPTQVQSLEECRETTEQYLEFMGISSSRDAAALPIGDIAKSQREFMDYSELGAATYRVTVDGDLLKDFPIPAAAAGATDSMPMLIGTTKEEMGFINFKLISRFLDVEKIISDGVEQEPNDARRRISEAYMQAYGQRHGMSMLYTDLLFRIGSVWFAEAASRFSPVWMYRFDYELDLPGNSRLYAVHSIDLPYIFGDYQTGLLQQIGPFGKKLKEGVQVAREIQSDFITFARTGWLPWNRCSGENTPAKCYDVPVQFAPMVEPELKQLYHLTEYRKKSFSSVRGRNM